MLHAIILAGKPGTTVGPRTNVFSLSRVGPEMTSQVAQCSEQTATRFASVLALAEPRLCGRVRAHRTHRAHGTSQVGRRR